MKPVRPWSRVLRLLPGFLISALAIGALVFAVDWRKTADAWSHAQLWVLVPAMVCILGAMLARAIGWRYLMGNAVPIRRSFWVLNISYLLNGILPLRLGDVARAYLISRRRDDAPAEVTAGAALCAVALERMFDLAFTCVLVLSVFPLIAGVGWSSRVLLYAFGLALAFFLMLMLLGFLRGWILRAAGKFALRAPFLRPMMVPLNHFLDALEEVRNVRRSVPAFLWIGTALLLWAAEYWIVLRGFFPDAPVYWGLLSLVGGLIGVALPSSPSSLGVFEGAVTVVLTMSGMALSTVVAYALAIHMLNIVSLMALGALGLLIERQSLGSILAATTTAGKPGQDSGR
jgi:glycosyltransferase 2 family protein